MTEKVEFEKSAWRVWLFAILGVPFLLVGADLFFQRKLLGFFGDLIYGAEELPEFEPRDTILAVLFLVGGAVLTLWALKELLFPKKVFVADRQGVHLAVLGPFRPAVPIPWEAVADIEYKLVDDEGEARPAVRVEVTDRTGLPDHPWGARWVGLEELLIDATGWSPPASDLVDLLVEFRQSWAGTSADEA